jgi:phosphatidate cytidylyltransferase
MEAEPTVTPAVPSRNGRDLVAATAVGLVLAALLAAVLVLPPVALTVLIGVLLLGAHLELGRLFASLDRPVHVDVLLASTLVLLVATQTLGARGQAIGLGVLTIGALLRSLADRDRRDVLGTVSRTVLLGAWLTGLASYALLLRALDAPIVMLVTVVGAAAVSDTFAYIVGSRLGRHPIAPSVSPNKTWEGFLGGIVAAALFAAVVLPLDASSGALRGLVVGATVGVAGFLGDLVASMVKRDLGVKDLGRLLPGHGGVLDRVDGLLLGLPVGYALLVVLP